MKKFWRILLIILTSLLITVLVGPLLVPVPSLTDTLPPEQLADPDSQFIEINGLSVHVKTIGHGEPVFVLLHGFGASLFSWHAVMEPLSQYGTVIAYDRPAFGLTERPMTWTGENPYSPLASVDLLLGLLDHFNVQRAILVGNSAGGAVSMQYTLQHPNRVQALILVDPAVYEGDGGPSWLRPFYTTPQLNHLGPLIVRSIQSSGIDLIKMAWYDPSKITPETMTGYTKPLRADNWDRALWYFTAASQPSGLPERLSEFTLPVLVITGDTDKIVPTENSVRLAGALPNARLVIIPQAGHVSHEEQPALFMQAVAEYLRQTLNVGP
ncbi:MAG TPA: alpha/beta hydrolase [Anaerolineales bacterium]